jgi:hypothetical protein
MKPCNDFQLQFTFKSDEKAHFQKTSSLKPQILNSFLLLTKAFAFERCPSTSKSLPLEIFNLGSHSFGQ